jgi:putative autoinducer-2 (AI-2) aldolase
MIKTYYCDGFEEVVEACGNVPVVIAGGKKMPEREALQMAYDAVSKGASGVDMGRNIFQSDSPVSMIRAVRGIVHDKISVDEAYRIYEQGKASK